MAIEDYYSLVRAVKAGQKHGLIAVVGDSVYSGCDFTANAMRSNARTGCFAKYFADNFLYAPSSDASFYLSQNVYNANTAGGSIVSVPAYDSRLSFGAGWEAGDTPGDLGVGGAAFSNNGTTNDFSWNPGVSFDRIQYWYGGYSGSPQYELRINGTTSVGTLLMDQGTDNVYSQTFSVTAGSHTIQVRGNGTGGGFIYGGRVWTEASPKLHWVNASWWGATLQANALNTSVFSGVNTLSRLLAGAGVGNCATIFMIGGNDIAASRTEAQFKADYTTLVNAALVYGHAFMFGQVWGSSGISESTANTTNSWVQDVARTTGASYFDCRTLPNWDSFANADAQGWHAVDDLHLSSTGQPNLAARQLNRLLRVPAALQSQEMAYFPNQPHRAWAQGFR